MSWTPGALFNGMIAPDTKYAIKGVIWYQGEADGGPLRAPNYGRVFAALIKDWRRQWGEGDFPFLYVQISSFDTSAGGWGDTRDGQRRALSLINTGMAVTLDVGVARNVHPPDKQTVGARLAQAALGAVYGEQGEYSSPRFLQATTEPGAMRIWFTHAEGLTTRGAPQEDFEVAAEDKKFFPGSARIEKIGDRETVLVQSDKVPNPKYVRYGWSGVVKSYFYNAAGLPGGTFTSEP
jgi:sialate O-acetylesterase